MKAGVGSGVLQNSSFAFSWLIWNTFLLSTLTCTRGVTLRTQVYSRVTWINGAVVVRIRGKLCARHSQPTSASPIVFKGDCISQKPTQEYSECIFTVLLFFFFPKVPMVFIYLCDGGGAGCCGQVFQGCSCSWDRRCGNFNHQQ